MQRYTRTAVALHWLIALLIIFAFAIGLSMTAIEGVTPAKLKYYAWHKWVGVTVLGFACLRLLWRLARPAPPYPDSMPRWQQGAAHGLHGLLYLLMFAVPLSGYFYTLAAGVPVVYLGWWQLPVLIEKNQELKEVLKQVHYALNMTLLAAVVLHVAATLKHVFIDRDGIFKRMLP